MSEGPLRFLLLNGVVNEADAISRSLILKYEAIHEFFGPNVIIDIACYGGNAKIPSMRIFHNAFELICSDIFKNADCLIYEFGICYDLFDSVHVLPENKVAIGVWHNVTPPNLAPSFSTFNTLKTSLVQSTNLFHCDHIFCDSYYNLDELLPLEPSYKNISVLELPIEDEFILKSLPSPHSYDAKKMIQFLFVGRFVRSKGTLDLVLAFHRAAKAVPDVAAELILVGNTAFSDEMYLGEITAEIAKTGSDEIHFAGTATQAELLAHYARSDVFVMPSYHEGYCVPVLEAFASGCHVISYDAGNLASIVGEYGHTVPTGSVDALAEAISDYLRAIRDSRLENEDPRIRAGTAHFPAAQLSNRARAYAASHSISAYKQNFLTGLGGIMRRKGLWVS